MADRLTCLVVAMLFPVFVVAGELADPTRPPAILVEPVVATNGATETQPTGLTSIIISKTRRAAIIDGETVELNGKHGDDRLIEVNEGSVVLKGAQGRKVLALFPDVKMVSKNKKEEKAQAGKQENRPVAHEEKK